MHESCSAKVMSKVRLRPEMVTGVAFTMQEDRAPTNRFNRGSRATSLQR